MPDRSDQVIINEFGENLRLIRKSKKLSQPQLGHKADMSTNTINRIELGKTEASLTTIIRLAEALGIHPSELFPR